MKFTWERYDPEHDAQFFPTVTTAHWARYRWAMRYCEDKRVADIACGVGYGTHLLSQVATHTIGVDSDAQAVEHCRKTYPHCEFLWARASNFVLAEPVDVVVSLETLEHLDEPESFLERVKENLRSGGLFLCTTPGKGVKPVALYHKREFDRREFKNLLKAHFNEVRLDHQSMAWQIEGELHEVTPVYLVAICR